MSGAAEHLDDGALGIHVVAAGIADDFDDDLVIFAGLTGVGVLDEDGGIEAFAFGGDIPAAAVGFAEQTHEAIAAAFDDFGDDAGIAALAAEIAFDYFGRDGVAVHGTSGLIRRYE